MRTGVPIAFAALLAASIFEAHAAASGRVTSAQASYRLIDLDLDDGLTPSISFQAGPGFIPDSAWARVSDWHGDRYANVEEYGEGADPFVLDVGKTHAGAAGSATGQESIGSLALALTAYADGPGGGADARLLSHIVSLEQGFVLSPNSGIIVTSWFGIEAAVDRPGEMFDGSGQISISAPQTDGTYATYSRAERAVASFEPGGSPQLRHQAMVDVVYWNQQPVAVNGTISMSVHAYAVSPVPEPASLALTAAGAWLLLARWRRREACR